MAPPRLTNADSFREGKPYGKWDWLLGPAGLKDIDKAFEPIWDPEKPAHNIDRVLEHLGNVMSGTGEDDSPSQPGLTSMLTKMIVPKSPVDFALAAVPEAAALKSAKTPIVEAMDRAALKSTATAAEPFAGMKLGDLPSMAGEMGAVGPSKLGRSKKLIEDAGGTNFRMEGDVAKWTDAAGNEQSADLSQRFGPRNVGSSPRQAGMNPREPLRKFMDEPSGSETSVPEFRLEGVDDILNPGGNLPPSAENPPADMPPNAPPPRRDATFLENILGFPKSIKSSIDLPFLRQGAPEAFSHPIQTGKAIGASFRSITPSGYENVIADLQKSPRYNRMADLGVLNPDVEQQFPSQWAEKIPGVPMSERMYTGGMDTLRASRFEDIMDRMMNETHGPTQLSDEQAVAKVIGDLTGRGELPAPLDRIGGTLNSVMYGPKFRMAQIQQLNPLNYVEKTSRYASPSGIPLKEFRGDMAKYGAGVGAGLGTAAALGAGVETDPRSSDFEQARVGETRFGVGGLKPLINLISQGATSEKVTPGGDERDTNPVDAFAHWMRTGLSPGIPSMAVDAMNNVPDPYGKRESVRRDVMGRDISKPYQSGPLSDVPYAPWVVNQFSPMFPSDVYSASEDLGPLGGLSAALFGGLGGNVTTYDNRGYDKGALKSKKKKSVGGGRIIY